MQCLSRILPLATVLLTEKAAVADEDARPRIEVSVSIHGKSKELAYELKDVSFTDSNPALKGNAESYLATRAAHVLSTSLPVFRFELDDGGKGDVSRLQLDVSDEGYDPWPQGGVTVTVKLSVPASDLTPPRAEEHGPVPLPMTLGPQKDATGAALCDAIDTSIQNWVAAEDRPADPDHRPFFSAVPFPKANAHRGAGADKFLIETQWSRAALGWFDGYVPIFELPGNGLKFRVCDHDRVRGPITDHNKTCDELRNNPSIWVGSDSSWTVLFLREMGIK